MNDCGPNDTYEDGGMPNGPKQGEARPHASAQEAAPPCVGCQFPAGCKAHGSCRRAYDAAPHAPAKRTLVEWRRIYDARPESILRGHHFTEFVTVGQWFETLAAPVQAAPTEPDKWIFDPHDIEQGMMLNPAWLKLHGLTAKEATQGATPAPVAPVQAAPTEPLTDEQIGQWVAEAQRKVFGAVPQARYIVERALAHPAPVAADTEGKPHIPRAESRSKRIYIAGPMTGLPGWNFPAFNAKAAELRAEGWHVENPAEHGAQEGVEWADYLRYDIGRIATCEAIYLLPGWPKSRGATLEVHIACALGMQTYGAVEERAPQPVAADTLTEVVAQAIYAQWADKPGFVRWVDRGNSDMQDKARDIARAVLAQREASPTSAPVLAEGLKRIVEHASFDDGERNPNTLRGQLLMILEEANTLLASPPAQEPLLMQDENSGGDGRRYNEWHASRPDARLNAREAAAVIGAQEPPAVQEPLSEEEAFSLGRIASTNNTYSEGRFLAALFTRDSLIGFVRAIEAHHGIGAARRERP